MLVGFRRCNLRKDEEISSRQGGADIVQMYAEDMVRERFVCRVASSVLYVRDILPLLATVDIGFVRVVPSRAAVRETRVSLCVTPQTLEVSFRLSQLGVVVRYVPLEVPRRVILPHELPRREAVFATCFAVVFELARVDSMFFAPVWIGNTHSHQWYMSTPTQDLAVEPRTQGEDERCSRNL